MFPIIIAPPPSEEIAVFVPVPKTWFDHFTEPATSEAARGDLDKLAAILAWMMDLDGAKKTIAELQTATEAHDKAAAGLHRGMAWAEWKAAALKEVQTVAAAVEAEARKVREERIALDAEKADLRRKLAQFIG